MVPGSLWLVYSCLCSIYRSVLSKNCKSEAIDGVLEVLVKDLIDLDDSVESFERMFAISKVEKM